MAKSLLVKVYSSDEYADAPSYVHIVPEGDLAGLVEWMDAIKEMAARFPDGQSDPLCSDLSHVSWRLSSCPLEVTWLCYEALDVEGCKSNLVRQLDAESYLVVEDFEPNLGKEDKCGHRPYEFDSVDLERIVTYPDGDLMLVECHLDGGNTVYNSLEFPLEVLLSLAS